MMKKSMKLTALSIGCAAVAALGFAAIKPTVASAEMNAAISTFEVVGGAAIRKSTPEGIRFTARIDKDQRADGQTFGMVVMPTESFEGELTLSTPNVLDIPADQWVDEDAYAANEFDAEYDYYTAVVSGETDVFPEEYYNVLLSARGYVNDGTETHYTDTVSVRSIAYVAKMAQLGNEADPYGTIAKIAPKAEVALSKDEITLEYGATDDLALYIGNVEVVSNAAAKISVEYSSSNERIVSVDQNGKITSNHSGSATVSVTLTVDGGTPLVKTARVTVGRPEITSLDESLVQPTYDSVFVEGANSIQYVENVTVGDKTLDKAFHVHSDTTSYGGADAAKNGHYFTLPASVIQQAVEAGYTNVKIEYYSMAGMRGYAQTANTTAHFDDTFGRTEYASLSKTVALSKFVSGETYLPFVMGYFHNYDKNVYDGSQATDLYITEMIFTDSVKGNLIRENNLYDFTTGSATTMTYEENITVNGQTFEKAYHVHSDTTSWGSTDAINAGHLFTLSGTTLSAAANAGYTYLKITFYTLVGVRGYNGSTSNSSYPFYTAFNYAEYTEVTKIVPLSTFSNGNALIMAYFHNYDKTAYDSSQDADIYITEMIFTGNVKSDLVMLDNLDMFTTGTATTMAYEENVTVNSQTFEKAFHVHSDTTSYGGADAASAGHYFTLPASVIQQAVAAGYTNVKIEYYSMAGMRGYANTPNTDPLFNDTFGRTEYASLSQTVALSKLVSGETYKNFVMGYFHNYDKTAYDGSQPTDLYITSIQFTK